MAEHRKARALMTRGDGDPQPSRSAVKNPASPSALCEESRLGRTTTNSCLRGKPNCNAAGQDPRLQHHRCGPRQSRSRARGSAHRPTAGSLISLTTQARARGAPRHSRRSRSTQRPAGRPLRWPAYTTLCTMSATSWQCHRQNRCPPDAPALSGRSALRQPKAQRHAIASRWS